MLSTASLLLRACYDVLAQFPAAADVLDIEEKQQQQQQQRVLCDTSRTGSQHKNGNQQTTKIQTGEEEVHCYPTKKTDSPA